MIRADRRVFDDEGLAAASFSAVSASCTLELIEHAAQAHPKAPAITMLRDADPGSPVDVVSYDALLDRTVQMANLLRSLGVHRDDPVAILLPLVPEALMTIFGASTAGIAMPVNYLLSASHIAQMLDAVDCRVLVAYGDDDVFGIWSKAEEVCSQSRSLRRVIRVGGAPATLTEGVLDASSAMDAQSTKLAFEKPAPSDMAAYFHTGGTTGLPKVAQHTHRNQLFAAWASAHINGYAPGSCTLAGMPLFHVAGSLLLSLSIFSTGSHLVMLTPAGLRNKSVIANYWRLVHRHRPAIIGFPPTALMAVASVPVEENDLSSVVFCSSGGATLPVEAAAHFESGLGIPIREAYGMTETAGLIAYTPWFLDRCPGSVGRAVPCMEVRVVPEGVDPDEAKPLPPGARGVIVVRGPNVFPGYVDARMNQGVLTAAGWVITGDLGHIDEEGHVFVTGRAKDLIIRGSHNIDPLDIESAAAACPAVLQCAAVGQPDSYAGEVPVLYVTLKPQADLDAEGILAFVSDRVSETPARPRHVFVLDELPTTPVGKVFKPALRCDAAERVFRAELGRLSLNCTFTVEVKDEVHRGPVARIVLQGAGDDIISAVRKALVPYTFPYEINVAPNEQEIA